MPRLPASRSAPPVPSDAPDLLVIGAGAFGLWSARAALARGLSVIIAGEHAAPAASATPVGALAPHLAEPWTPLKAFQLAALSALGPEIAALEAETGLSAGYARPGRLSPLTSEAQRAHAEARVADCAARWGAGAGVTLIDRPDAAGAWDPAWLAPAAHGALHDDLTARVDPPALLAALRAACAGAGAGFADLGGFLGWSAGAAGFERGEIRAGAAILAAGTATLRLFPSLGGGPVHGQAARLRVAAPRGAPLIGAPGLWITPHAGGRVAVGATSQGGRADLTTDKALDRLLARAEAHCPLLAGAEVETRWAGLRPRAASSSPVVGPAPGAPGLVLATGGYKIGLGVAAACGRAAAAMATGATPDDLPAEFLPPADAPLPEFRRPGGAGAGSGEA
ncbi:Glycine/D-amino acid oxidase [Albimonas donghaensis]|uniref:Glycine/D-amino acid oxidase n=1 Tax=Albimonas donghaensis TaxID=356660 RepID=A0A1H2WMD2_9RHOB|nr:FAD-dependent oxidoreductase [Albimonas donghaensis]SDW81731.1 Glycine/D-amino acid oxidase [Albimonas donghaensis]